MTEITNLIEKSRRFLKTAELTLKDGDFDSCGSRCYYAIFYMTEALLMIKDLTVLSHKGLITIFSEHFIKTEIFRKDLGKIIQKAYRLRQKGDYASGFGLTKEEAEDILGQAKQFIDEIEDYINENSNNS